MKPTHFTLVALLLVTLGCGTTKSIEGSVIADKNLSAKALLNAHKAASQDFNTLAARMQVKYDSKGVSKHYNES